MNLTYTRIELKRAMRNPRFLIFSFAFPVFLFLIQSNVFVTDADPEAAKAIAVIMVNMLAFGVFFAAIANGARLATERAAGWQRQLRLTPLTGRGYMLGKGVTGLLLGVPVLVAVPAHRGAGERREPRRGADGRAILIGTWLGAIPFVLLGLLIGQLARPETLQPLNMGISLVMGFLGGHVDPRRRHAVLDAGRGPGAAELLAHAAGPRRGHRRPVAEPRPHRGGTGRLGDRPGRARDLALP